MWPVRIVTAFALSLLPADGIATAQICLRPLLLKSDTDSRHGS
jgi:hypothetical protein